jgi:hypothetical protein
LPVSIAGLPGKIPFATALMKNKLKKLDLPPVREYLQILMDTGAKLYPRKLPVIY